MIVLCSQFPPIPTVILEPLTKLFFIVGADKETFSAKTVFPLTVPPLTVF
jgi:hypothetical protein